MGKPMGVQDRLQRTTRLHSAKVLLDDEIRLSWRRLSARVLGRQVCGRRFLCHAGLLWTISSRHMGYSRSNNRQIAARRILDRLGRWNILRHPQRDASTRPDSIAYADVRCSVRGIRAILGKSERIAGAAWYTIIILCPSTDRLMHDQYTHRKG